MRNLLRFEVSAFVFFALWESAPENVEKSIEQNGSIETVLRSATCVLDTFDMIAIWVSDT